MLTKSSVLHYWSARYGLNPRIGGRPVFTRNSAGLFTTQEGEVDSAIINTPRLDWATLNLPNGLTERRKVLTLELARTNSLTFSSDFSNAVWAKTTMTVTTGIADPAGGTSACTLTATGANALVDGTLSAGSSIPRQNTVWLRRRTGSGVINLLKPDNSVYVAVPVTADWQRFTVGGIGVSRKAVIQIVTSGDAIDAWLFQQEDASFATAGIPTTGAAATRATDTVYWNLLGAPQAFYLYLRFIEQGTGIDTFVAGRLAEICDAPDNNPRFIVYNPNSTGYGVFFHNGVASVSSTLVGYPALGDTVELVAQLQPTGVVQLYQSINGGAISVSPGSGALALPAAWSGSRLWLNSAGTAVGGWGSAKFAEAKMLKFADVVSVTNPTIFSEIQAFELGPNGDVL